MTTTRTALTPMTEERERALTVGGRFPVIGGTYVVVCPWRGSGGLPCAEMRSHDIVSEQAASTDSDAHRVDHSRGTTTTTPLQTAACSSIPSTLRPIAPCTARHSRDSDGVGSHAPVSMTCRSLRVAAEPPASHTPPNSAALFSANAVSVWPWRGAGTVPFIATFRHMPFHDSRSAAAHHRSTIGPRTVAGRRHGTARWARLTDGECVHVAAKARV